MAEPSTRDWALRYIRLGWPVIPLWPHDARGTPTRDEPQGRLIGKEPLGKLVPHGSKDATLNESQARGWWERYPQANLGLATGFRFVAIDIDAKAGGDESWDMLRAQYGGLPNTIEAITGTGGRHILFRLPADFLVHNSQGKLAPGVDVRGAGGYIVAAPSIHPETKRAYEWDGLAEIEQAELAEAPVWLLRLLIEADQRKPGPRAALALEIAQGSRNDTLFKAASRLRRMGYSEQEIYASLVSTNALRCKPPLAETELRTIAGSAARYSPDTRADLFGRAITPDQQQAEVPLGEADIEALAADACARNDLKAAFELAPLIGKLRPVTQALIKGKLRLHFKQEFPRGRIR